MALHHQLPIYKLASDLASLAADLTKNMPRDWKRTLGEKVLIECFDVVTLIFRANVTTGHRHAHQGNRRNASVQALRS